MRSRAARAWSSSRTAGTIQATSNSRPSGSLAYRLLVVPWSEAAPRARAPEGQAPPLGQGVALPGQVVQADGAPPGLRGSGAGADLEQAQVVVVGRGRGLD